MSAPTASTHNRHYPSMVIALHTYLELNAIIPPLGVVYNKALPPFFKHQRSDPPWPQSRYILICHNMCQHDAGISDDERCFFIIDMFALFLYSHQSDTTINTYGISIACARLRVVGLTHGSDLRVKPIGKTYRVFQTVELHLICTINLSYVSTTWHQSQSHFDFRRAYFVALKIRWSCINNGMNCFVTVPR